MPDELTAKQMVEAIKRGERPDEMSVEQLVEALRIDYHEFFCQAEIRRLAVSKLRELYAEKLGAEKVADTFAASVVELQDENASIEAENAELQEQLNAAQQEIDRQASELATARGHVPGIAVQRAHYEALAARVARLRVLIAALHEKVVDWDAIEAWCVKHECGRKDYTWHAHTGNLVCHRWGGGRELAEASFRSVSSLPEASHKCRDEVNSQDAEATDEHVPDPLGLKTIAEHVGKSALDKYIDEQEIPSKIPVLWDAVIREIRDRLNELKFKQENCAAGFDFKKQMAGDKGFVVLREIQAQLNRLDNR